MATTSEVPRKSTQPFKVLISIALAALVVITVGVILYFALTKIPSTVIESTDLSAYVDDHTGLDWSNAATYRVELSESLTLTNPGIYYLSGEINDGCITINADGNTKLILDNVTVKNSHGPAIFVQEAKNVVLYAVGENYFEDGSTYKGYAEDEIGTIFSHDDLFFDGDGSFIVQSHKEDAIVSKDDLKFFAGTYNITSADDAIRGKDSVYIANGDFTIEAVADGIKSTNTTDDGRGYVHILNGNFNLKVGDDAIHASSDLTIDDGKILISASYEGLEGTTITINGGDISVTSSDDGINAAGGNDASGLDRPGFDPFHSMADANDTFIEINGGKISVSASGDGVDSNGSIYLNGGELTVYGPTSSADGALDYDREFVVTGGTLLAGGASGMAQGISQTSTIFSVNINFTSNVSSGNSVKIVDESENEVISYQSAKSFSSLIVASLKFVQGRTYTIKLDNETYQSFTISSAITQVGNGANGMFGGSPNGSMSIPGDMPQGNNFPNRGQMR